MVVNTAPGIALKALATLPDVLDARIFRPGGRLASLHCDSRRVGVGVGFLAMRGLHTDGHAFVDDALAADAPVLFVSDAAVYRRLTASPPPTLEAVFRVPPGRAPLARLAAAVCGDPARALRLLGVTGTNGKTTTTYLVAQMLAAMQHPCGIIGTLGLRIGEVVLESARTTPEAPDIHRFLQHCVMAGTDTVAMEVSSIGITMERTAGLPFAAAAFTNLTLDHLDFHPDLAAYRESKFRLFTEYETACAVVNVDDAAGVELVDRLRACGRPTVLTYGLEGNAALSLRVEASDADGVAGQLRYEGGSWPFRFPLLGRFNQSNLLAALGLLIAGGESPEALAPAIAACRGASGRFEHVALDAPFTVLVDYAHTPDALENLLQAARPLVRGRLRVAFGAGGDRDRAKRPQMGAIAERLADDVTLTNDNPRNEEPQAILAEIAAGMQDPAAARCIANRREAIHAALDAAQPGDVVVIAGKGDETYQEIAGIKHPFDDRTVVREWGALRNRKA